MESFSIDTFLTVEEVEEGFPAGRGISPIRKDTRVL